MVRVSTSPIRIDRMAIPIATNLCLNSNVHVRLVMAAAALLPARRPHGSLCRFSPKAIAPPTYSAEDRQSRG